MESRTEGIAVDLLDHESLFEPALRVLAAAYQHDDDALDQALQDYLDDQWLAGLVEWVGVVADVAERWADGDTDEQMPKRSAFVGAS